MSASLFAFFCMPAYAPVHQKSPCFHVGTSNPS